MKPVIGSLPEVFVVCRHPGCGGLFRDSPAKAFAGLGRLRPEEERFTINYLYRRGFS